MDVRNMNLNWLVPLVTLLETRNVTKAAQQLHLSQSALSGTLSQLRAALNDPLLVRRGRSLVLTPYAETLLVPLREVLADIDHLLRSRPDFDPIRDARTYRIISSDYSAQFLLQPFLASIRDSEPAMSIRVEPLQDDSRDRIVNDDVDVLVVSTQYREELLPDYPIREMFRDRFVLVAWEQNNTLPERPTLEDLKLLSFVQYVTGENLNLADRALDRMGVQRQVEVTTESQLLVPYLLTGTNLVALIPERLARHAQAVAQLRVADAPVALPTIRDSCVWNPRRSADPGLMWLLAELCRVAGTLPEPGAPLANLDEEL